MPGKLSSQEIESIYRAAASRAGTRRAQTWPDIRPARYRRRRNHFAVLLWSGVIVVSVVGVGVYAATSDRFNFRKVGATLLSLAAKTRTPRDAATVAPARQPEIPAEPDRLAALPAGPSVPEAAAAPDSAPPSPPELRLDHALDTVFPVSRDPDAAAQPAAPPVPEASSATAAPGPAETPRPVKAPEPVPTPSKPSVAAAPPPAPAAPAPVKPAQPPAPATEVAALTGASKPAPPSFPLPPRRPRFAAGAAEPAPAPAPAKAPAEAATPHHAALSAALARQMAVPPDAAARATPAGAPDLPASSGLPATTPGAAPTAPGYWATPAAPAAPVATTPSPSWLATTGDATAGGAGSGQLAAADCTGRGGPGCATPPRHYSWYAGAQLSMAGNAVSKFTAPNVDIKAELEKAGGANVFAGYRANFGTRFEAELFYRRHGFDETTVNSDGGAGTLLGLGSLSGVSGDGAGHLSMTGLMANVFQDFKLMNSVKPFIGAGIGVARVNVDNGGLPQAALLDGNDDVLAYQLAGGIAFALRDNLDLFVEYRYFATDDYDIRYVTGATARGSLETHNFGVGIRYGF